jgi:hypothetical protein
MDAYYRRRIADLDAEEKAAAALDRQADLMALENAGFGLAVGQLQLREAVRRWLGG